MLVDLSSVNADNQQNPLVEQLFRSFFISIKILLKLTKAEICDITLIIDRQVHIPVRRYPESIRRVYL